MAIVTVKSPSGELRTIDDMALNSYTKAGWTVVSSGSSSSSTNQNTNQNTNQETQPSEQDYLPQWEQQALQNALNNGWDSVKFSDSTGKTYYYTVENGSLVRQSSQSAVDNRLAQINPPVQTTNVKWSLTSGVLGSNGVFTTKPTLTVNGVNYKFNTVADYVNTLKTLGFSTASQNTIKNYLEKSGNASGSEPISSTTTFNESSINALYQKYFGRNANSDEINYWKTQSASSLETELKQTYKNASGIDYDGSPIQPGQTKTNNQLASSSSNTNTNTNTNTGTTTSNYTGNSIVDYLSSTGKDSSYAARAALASQLGIANYRGTATQNTQLLNMLRSEASTVQGHSLSSLTNYPTEFQSYINSIKDKVTFSLNEKSLAELYDQYKTMGAPEAQTGNSAPMQEGEYEFLVDRYKQAGYTDAQAKAAVDVITANRTPYEGDIASTGGEPTYSENSMIDAIVKALNPQALADAEFKWTEQLQEEARKIAEQDFGTYYNRLFESEQAQLTSDLTSYQTKDLRAEEDAAVKKEEIKTDYEQALKEARRSYASSGLTYSTERGNRESQLSDSLTKGLTSVDTTKSRTQQDIETMRKEALMKAEQRLGTEKVKTASPNYQSVYSTDYMGDIEREKKKQIALDIEKQKEDYLRTY